MLYPKWCYNEPCYREVGRQVNKNRKNMIGRIYVGYHQKLLHTKIQALGLVVSDREIILCFPIVSLWEKMTPGAWPI